MTDCRGDSRKSSYSSGDNNHFDITGYERKKIKQNIWKRRGEEETGAAAQGDRENKVVCMVDGRYDMREIVVPPSRWVSRSGCPIAIMSTAVDHRYQDKTRSLESIIMRNGDAAVGERSGQANNGLASYLCGQVVDPTWSSP